MAIQHPSEERLHRLDQVFGEAIEALHQKLEILLACEPFSFGTRPGKLPASVVYTFSEGPTFLYVGRSNSFKQRLGNHCRPSSGANQSAFAFLLAREAAGITEVSYRGSRTRKALMETDEFWAGFSAAKARLAAMQIRYVEETDQVRQALLEIYCAVALKTPYNDFGTH